MGAITIHANEHLAPSDKGVAMMRRRLREGIRAVAASDSAARYGAARCAGADLRWRHGINEPTCWQRERENLSELRSSSWRCNMLLTRSSRRVLRR